MNPSLVRRPRVALALLAAVALALTMLAGTVAGRHGATARAEAHVHATAPRAMTAAQAAFHDRMRKLWEDHITWTRLAIVTFADDSKGFPATAARLQRNQNAIGNAIKPYYGKAAGQRLSTLLHAHINIAVEVLQAAKAGDTQAFNAAKARWYKNANAIADFLAHANPKHWPDRAMRAAMRHHLDQTLAEAANELQGKYAASVQDYEAVHHHILAMADTLSSGIIKAFPGRFR
jgi:hypothetical protein